MNELVAKLLKLKTPAKIGVAAGLVVALCGIYYQFFYSDLSDGITGTRAAQTKLREELGSYEKRKTEYLGYRAELKQLQEEQRDLLRVLPRKDEIASFLSNIEEQAEMSGLEVVSVGVENEMPEELYVKIPVKMEVRGGFHAITKFFKNVSELKRIVNVENLSLIPEQGQPEDGSGLTRMRAKFVAATFRYQNPQGDGAGGGT
jgi:type IV pilus assembly protein PilO